MKNVFIQLLGIGIITFLVACDGGITKYHTDAQVIAIQPYEVVDMDYLTLAKEAIEDIYGYDVEVLPAIKLPEIALKQDGRKKLYDSEKLLVHLANALKKSDKATRIIGFLNYDLYSKTDEANVNTIVSKSRQGGEVSVISFNRIKKTARNKSDFTSRLKKISLKELGHTLGLEYCINEGDADTCLMVKTQGRPSILDNIKFGFCSDCSRKLNREDESE